MPAAGHDGAERIAPLVAKLARGHIALPPPNLVDRDMPEDLREFVFGFRAKAPTVVDVGCLAEVAVRKWNRSAGVEPCELSDDYPCVAPPWREAVFGLVIRDAAAQTTVLAHLDAKPAAETDWPSDYPNAAWVLAYREFQEIPSRREPALVRALIVVIGEAGDLMDIRPLWEAANSQTAVAVTLEALNFLNCRNVAAAIPARPRPVAKRLARLGVGIHTINVYPPGRPRGAVEKEPGEPLASPESPVRGHYAHYGNCCPGHEPRGLLFGKLEGKFWIAQHLRGSTEHGEAPAGYRVHASRHDNSPATRSETTTYAES